MKTLFHNVTILTMDATGRVLENGWLLTDGEDVAALGTGSLQEGRALPGLPPEALAGAERIDGKNGLLLPGFVNTHCHVSMIPFRSMGDDCPDRLRRFLFPLELEAMTPRLVYLAALYGIGELLLSGTTTFLDMYYFEEEVARACLETGIRGYLGETLIGQRTCDSPDAPYGGFAYQKPFLENYRGNARVIPILAPHGTTTVSPEMLSKAHELAVREDTLFTLHAAEMDYEMQFFREKGTSPLRFLQEIGALSERTLLAHCIHADARDLDLIRESGARIAHCIGSNTKAGKGVAPMHEAAQRGIPFGLGTDGASSGNTLSMYDQLRLVSSAQKTRYRDRSLFPAKDVLAAATVGGARALRAGSFGSLAVGQKADLQLVETESVNMFPIFDAHSALVYAANAKNVSLVMANGRILVRGGQLTELDLARVRAELLSAMEPFLRAAEEYRGLI